MIRRPAVLILLVLTTVMAVHAQAPRAFRRVTTDMLANPPSEDWLMYSRTYDAQRFSPLSEITRQNVGQLRGSSKKNWA